MAKTLVIIHTLGHCSVSLQYKDKQYPRVKLSPLAVFAEQVHLGKDLPKLYEAVQINFRSDKPILVVCGLMAAHTRTPLPFGDSAVNFTSIAAKSRRHSDSDDPLLQRKCKISSGDKSSDHHSAPKSMF